MFEYVKVFDPDNVVIKLLERKWYFKVYVWETIQSQRKETSDGKFLTMRFFFYWNK